MKYNRLCKMSKGEEYVARIEKCDAQRREISPSEIFIF